MISVRGFCPFGCGQTLVVRTGRVVCDGQSCPHPLAVNEILSHPETEHLVQLEQRTFSVQHPLRERVDGALFDCKIYDVIRSLPGPPAPPGMYRTSDGSSFEPVGVLDGD